MIDPNFDPYQQLLDLKQGQVKLLNNQSRLAHTNAQQQELNAKIIEQVNALTNMVNYVDHAYTVLEARLKLLEIVNEEKLTNTTSSSCNNA